MALLALFLSLFRAHSAEPPPLAIPDDDKDMVAAVAEARRRIPEFKLLLKSPQDGVTVRVAVWSSGIRTFHEAALTGIKGDQLEIELPPEAPPPHRKTIPIAEIHDWTVVHAGGKRSGGFTTRVMFAKARALWGKLPPDLKALEESFEK